MKKRIWFKFWTYFVLPDYLIVFSLLFMLGTHSFTIYMIQEVKGLAVSKEEANNLIKYVEGNPVMAYVFTLQRYQQIAIHLLAPSILVGCYYYMRNKLKKHQVLLTSIAMIFFIMMFINFVNDAAYFVTYMYK